MLCYCPDGRPKSILFFRSPVVPHLNSVSCERYFLKKEGNIIIIFNSCQAFFYFFFLVNLGCVRRYMQEMEAGNIDDNSIFQLIYM